MVGALGQSAREVGPERRQVQEVHVQPGQPSVAPRRFTRTVSEHRFGLMMLACVLVLIAELVVFHTLVGP